MAVETSIKLAKVSVTLCGLPPGMMMNSKRMMELDGENPGKKPKRTPAQEAELHCHWTKVGGKKVLAFPWVGFYKAICAGGKHFKYGKSSMVQLLAATLSSELDMIPLNTDKFEVYEEFVRIPPRTGAMVKIGRPRLAAWEASFVITVDDELYKGGAELLKPVIEMAGKMVGIGPWRPELKGPYGRWRVTKFEVA